MKSRTHLLILLMLAFVLPPAALIMAQQAGAGQAQRRPQGPCDIYAAAGTPCVAAHSTTRALAAAYNGSLYQLLRASDGKMLDVGIVQPTTTDAGGYADAAAQDAFCANTLCVINKIYDQSGKGNDLIQAPPGPRFPGPAKGGFDTQPIADMAPITIMGHKAYGVFIMPGMGYRNNNAVGLAIDDEPEGIYAVVDGTHFDSGCCFDYGNAETNSGDNGPGTMENVYFGTATTWGRGSGTGPWLMADMEAGLYSGYNTKQNDADPMIDSWRFVTGVVNGGGGNKWTLRGGNAQQGQLATFYSGERPASRENNRYFPMHKQGSILMGTGGDNGNGSSGTFYEGVMTTGFPSDATTDAVQANIVAAKYDVPRVTLSRVTTFTPGSSQAVVATFTNASGVPAASVKLSIALPAGWTSPPEKTLSDPVAPGASVSATFKITAPASTSSGYLTTRAQWTADRQSQSESTTSRIRNVLPVKLNEIQLLNASAQFIELYNAGTAEADISNWSLVSTASQGSPLTLATIPASTKIPAKGYYLLAQANAGLAAPAGANDTILHLTSTAGFAPDQSIEVGGEKHTIKNAGSAASPPTTIFIPVSTGPRLTFPAGTTSLPVASAAGFAASEKISIDLGGNLELATVTAVGKAATQTTLSSPAAKGDSSIRVAAVANISVGDTLTLGAGERKETVTVKSITPQAPGDAGAAPRGRGPGRGGAIAGTIELTAPLQRDHAATADLSDPGTGITFTPGTKFPHQSGDAVQPLGAGVTLDAPLAKNHDYGTPIHNAQATDGYAGPPAPQQWFGAALSSRAGSLALIDASGNIVDAVVYGSQQSNSSGNGTIASPELATLEGDQSKGGCIAVTPAAGRGGRGAPAAGTPGRSIARTSDGADTDSNCADFTSQAPTPAAPNQKNP